MMFLKYGAKCLISMLYVAITIEHFLEIAVKPYFFFVGIISPFFSFFFFPQALTQGF